MIKKCRCGWSYNADLSSCPLCGNTYKKGNCKACGDVIDRCSKKELCRSCADLAKKIYNNHLSKYRQKLKFKDGTIKLSNRFIKVNDEIRVSDAMFTTDLCDQKCDVCKYGNCILPEEN